MASRAFLYLSFLIYPFFKSEAQSSYVPFDRDYYHLIDRYLILGHSSSQPYPTAFRPYRRDEIVQWVDSLSEDSFKRNEIDDFNIDFLKNDSWEFSKLPTPASKKTWKSLYQKPSDFFYHRGRDLDVHINPLLYFDGGKVAGGAGFTFRNTRGLTLRGSIDRKIGFYSSISTTEISLPPWHYRYALHNGAVPGEGFWKPYGDQGFSYFSATGYFTFKISRSIRAQMGHDRNFVGDGYRSMILSDFSSPYLFLKLNTRLWKLTLTNLWAQMNADIIYKRGRPTDGRYPQKWFSHHRLGVHLGRKLDIGFYESVMASQLDWNYLNPIIFYRWVEHQLGTPDKVMMGTDFRWNLYPSMQIYGQFTIDEFVFNEFFGIAGKKSSRNKHGLQLGYKYINLFKAPNLDLQLEYNHARPYTYQEKFDHQSFSNYRTPLTHPRGANFREVVAILRYQPFARLRLDGTGLYQVYGSDPDVFSNFGGDVLKNRTIQSTNLFGNRIGQGIENHLITGTLNASYMLKHQLFLDVLHTHRKHSLSSNTPNREHFSQLSLRMNIGRQDSNF